MSKQRESLSDLRRWDKIITTGHKGSSTPTKTPTCSLSSTFERHAGPRIPKFTPFLGVSDLKNKPLFSDLPKKNPFPVNSRRFSCHRNFCDTGQNTGLLNNGTKSSCIHLAIVASLRYFVTVIRKICLKQNIQICS